MVQLTSVVHSEEFRISGLASEGLFVDLVLGSCADVCPRTGLSRTIRRDLTIRIFTDVNDCRKGRVYVNTPIR